jgi:hypothetical protein
MTAMNDPRDVLGEADDADVAEQQRPVGEEEPVVLPDSGFDDADEGDLLEQVTPVPEDDDDEQRD